MTKRWTQLIDLFDNLEWLSEKYEILPSVLSYTNDGIIITLILYAKRINVFVIFETE